MKTIQRSRYPSARRSGAIGLASVCTSLWAGGCSPKINDDSLAVIDSATLASWLDEGRSRCLVLDARPEEGYKAGHIPTAKWVPMPQIKENERDPAWEAFRSIVVYGEDPGPGLARPMAKRLMQAQYKDVRYLMGGMIEWRSQGRPVSRD